MSYLHRVVDSELAARLEASGGVVVEGPKACGKTSTARQIAASEVRLDVDAEARLAISVDPTLVLAGATPRLIDEWQLEPAIWNHVRRAIDDRGLPGQFILTGSAVPADDITRHTGAGRLTRLRMRPMSLFETGHSSGTISLAGLLEGESAHAVPPGLSVADLAERIAVGGWPGGLGRSVASSLRGVRDYLDEIRRVDIARVAGPRRDPTRVGRLLRSIARNVATYAADTALGADAGGAAGPLDNQTVADYLDALERLMIVEDQPAWAPHLRSRSVLRAAAKRHFVDPSLAVAALRTSPAALLRDLETLGCLFESMVVRDLRVYAQAVDATVFAYRDNTVEVDAIVEVADGRWGAFEVKLGAGRIDEAAANLLRFAARIDTDRTGKPAVLAVITGGGYGFMRDDGVAVVPIVALKP